jgi:hypothetical protein
VDIGSLEAWEWASYVVTVVGLPFAIAVFIWEQRRERANEDEELYQRLSEEYAEFSKLLLANADLGLMTEFRKDEALTEEQLERRSILFDLLLSLFERAYILVYEVNGNEQSKRLWASWDDYIRSWMAREDFRESIPSLLLGEDPDFVAYITEISNTIQTSAR